MNELIKSELEKLLATGNTSGVICLGPKHYRTVREGQVMPRRYVSETQARSFGRPHFVRK